MVGIRSCFSTRINHSVAQARLMSDLILRTSRAQPLLAEGLYNFWNDLLPMLNGGHADCVALLVLGFIVLESVVTRLSWPNNQQA